MTDLSLARHLSSPHPDLQAAPLQVNSYFSDAVFRAEKSSIFANAPQYVGHTLAAPNRGDYYALPQEGEGRALLHTSKGLELISNVCRHRQAIMLHGRGHQEQSNIICPLHRWTYDTSGVQPTGSLIGAPHFEHDPCLHLNNYALQSWNGLQFDATRSSHTDLKTLLSGLPKAKDLDFSG